MKKNKRNKSLKPRKENKGKTINLLGDPEEVFPVQAISWHFDPDDFYYYILLGANKNPLTNTYAKVFVLHISRFAAWNFYNSAIDFFSKVPSITNPAINEKLQKAENQLKNQLSSLVSSFTTFPCQAIKISYAGGEADLTCYAIYSSHLDEVKKGLRPHVEPQPMVRFTCGIETLVFFIDSIKKTIPYLSDESRVMLPTGAENE